MQLPNMLTHDYFTYWAAVENGLAAPDEWQAALMALVEKALAEGVFYSKDLLAYVQANAAFVPQEFWGCQFKNTPTEGGKMGMEIYCARAALENAKVREANASALAGLRVGMALGSLLAIGKTVHKCAIKAIDGASVEVHGTVGSRPCSFKAEARFIPKMQAAYKNRKG